MNLYSKICLFIFYGNHIDIEFVLGLYRLGLLLMNFREYLTTPPIIEKRTIAEKI